jgi:antitoxin component of MazEF toxin-antitoxin module
MENIKQFKGKVWKSGNSIVVTIPFHLVKTFDIKEKEIITIQFEKEGGKIEAEPNKENAVQHM